MSIAPDNLSLQAKDEAEAAAAELREQLARLSQENEELYSSEREGMASFSQEEVAQAFMRLEGDWLGYDKAGGKWLEWRLIHWVETDHILHRISEVIGGLLPKDLNAGQRRKELERYQSRANMRDIERLAIPYLTREWNPDVDLIGLPGGYTLDTHTGGIHLQDEHEYITLTLPEGIADFDRSKPSVAWDNCVWESLASYDLKDRFAVKAYLQEWAGSALSGYCGDESMVFLHGVPGTGKSTFVETLLKVFGSYGASVAGVRVTKDHANQHLQWMAGLDGKRLVSINELPQNAKWESEGLNKLVSGENIEANRMRQDSINFISQAHVIITSNHRPTAQSSGGLWRRLRLINFQTLPEERNGHLKTELASDLAGVFVWVLEGLHRWIAKGRELTTPDIIMGDTAQYQSDADPIRQFAEERLVIDPAQSTLVSTIHDAFTAWWEDEVGTKSVPSKHKLGTALDDMGYSRAVPGGGGKPRARHGVGMNAD